MTTPHLSEQDLELVFRYSEGRMEVAEAIEFELRLGDEPELAAALDGLESVQSRVREAGFSDPDVRRELGADGDAQSRTGWPGWRWGPPLAVAAAAATALVVLWPRDGRHDLACEVAALPLSMSTAGYNGLLGLAPEFMPEGNWNDTRSEAEPAPEGGFPAPEEYTTRVRDLEHARSDEAMSKGWNAVASGRYALPVRPVEDCHALVIALVDDDQDGGLIHSTDAPLPAGETSYLPRFPVDVLAAEEVSVDGGFNIPYFADELTALVALRVDAADAVLLEELERELAGLAPLAENTDSVADWLAERGFAVYVVPVLVADGAGGPTLRSTRAR